VSRPPDARARRRDSLRLRSRVRRRRRAPQPEALQALRATDYHFTDGNRLELYREGRAGLSAMLEAIEGARRQIHFETYILRADHVGTRLLSLLATRARAGVEVRVLYDAIGSLGLAPLALEELRAAGADVVAFNPLRRMLLRLTPMQRDHRKILVIDDEVGFVGGLNVGDEYVESRWRDAHVRVAGPVVRALQAAFLESWFRADAPDPPWSQMLEPLPEAAGDERLAVLADGPTYHRRRMRDLFVAALDTARRRVRIASPYFIPGPRILAAMMRAVDRGVAVELITAGTTDHPVLRWAAHSRLRRLLRRGVRVYEVEGSMMHAKIAVFDEGWAIVGTSNLDRQSLRHSYEVNLIIDGGDVPGRLSNSLDDDLRCGRELSPEDLGRTSALVRWRNDAAALVLRHL